jgi:serine phosphatase RsbU (regulator of sigma subunit)
VSTEPAQRGADSPEALAALAEGSRALADGRTLDEALATIVAAARLATDTDVVVARVLDASDGQLRVRAVKATSEALAAELEGSRFPVSELPLEEAADVASLPGAVRRAVERAGAASVLLVPIVLGEQPVGSLELLRSRGRFGPSERHVARLVAYHVGLAVRSFGPNGTTAVGERTGVRTDLERAGEVLAAAADEARTAEAVARLAAEATGARGALLWRRGDGPGLELAAAYGVAATDPALEAAVRSAVKAFDEHAGVSVEESAALPGDAATAATLQLGHPPVGALQLLFAAGAAPDDATLKRLVTFGVRAAHALRASEQARATELELERTRALLDVLGRTTARLSLAHTLQTAVEQVGLLLDADRLAVYLYENERLFAAAGLGLAGPHIRVAERLLELSLGVQAGVLVIEDAAAHPGLAPVHEAVQEAGMEAAVAVPLVVHEGVIGLVAAYPPRGRSSSPDERTLLTAVAAQLAVAVQNAQLHEEAKQAGDEKERALNSEREAARRVHALYEISRSFAQSLSLEATIEAVVRTVAGLLAVDAAVIRMPDERREQLVVRALHVTEPRLESALRPLLQLPQPIVAVRRGRPFRTGEPTILSRENAPELGAGYELLVPFLEKGSTAAVVPIATSTEVLATLTLLSLDPARPLTDSEVEVALLVAGQAALAIDNARLYQQQKDFADTMQRSLLPSSAPQLEGLELGDVYESSARVEVGGDVYDYLTLDDGRLAVVLGDVTGHGIDATADMAMTKFVFRSLARDRPEPGEFLAAANEVVVDEVASGKFVTMVYLTVDPRTGDVACASAGHPAPRLVGPDGSVTMLPARGLALGIDAPQTYAEVRATLEPGGSAVVYTDGVVEARRDGELYGTERLDALLAARHDLPAGELARAVLAECRSFAGGELADDCAVVVIKRSG